MINKHSRLKLVLLCLVYPNLTVFIQGQIDNNGCVGGNFGIDAGLYSNIIEYGDGTPAADSRDWFYSNSNGGTGLGIINESSPSEIQMILQGGGNPTYERRMNSGLSSIVDGQIMIDAIYTRDYFGGTGGTDLTTFETASKNGEDPAIWDPGPMNVLGKNDLIDVAGHMFRDGTGPTSNLWFVGLINRAEPGGAAYMDFEFYVEEVTYSPGSGFSSGGPQLGHTAFLFDGSGAITKIGDLILNVALTGGGTDVNVQLRIWVSYADFLAGLSPPGFSYGPEFDGAFNGAPYGYAQIIPNITDICGYVNRENENPLAPPWGTLNTKYHEWGITYSDYSVSEVGVNLTALGLDHASLSGADPCYFPLNTFMVKTRASESFTAQLKDFAGPYKWGAPDVTPEITGDPTLSCLNPTTTLSADNIRPDIDYEWTTEDGNIMTDPTLPQITVDQPGTYYLQITYPTGCTGPPTPISVYYDPTKPFFNTPTTTTTVSCNGNDGTVNLTVSGATSPYTYMWSNGQTTQDISGLAPGSYSATITDVWGCTVATDLIVVSARIPVLISDPLISIPTCFGYENGAITHAISGGNPPLMFLWSSGNTTEDLLNIGAGTYTLTITDEDGCMTTASYTVNQPPMLTSSIVKTDDTDPDPILGTGTANLTVTGGTMPYTYVWTASQTGIVPMGQENNQDLNSLDYGSYTVIVTDVNGCTTSATIFIYEPEVCNDGIDNDGDGLGDCDDVSSCKPTTPGPITPGDILPCIGVSFPVTYTVPVNPAYDSYQWTYPATATYVSGQLTNVLTVYWNSTTGGTICVQGKKFLCLSDPLCISVSPHDKPPIPQGIIQN